MTTRSFPFDDVPLDTQEWARLTHTLAGDGVVLGHGDLLNVEATAPETMAVQVRPGRAFVRGRWFEVVDSPETVELAAANASNPRIDRIVLRRDLAERTVELGRVTGTAATSPTPPSLTQDPEGIWEIPLRQVYVRANATSIRGSDLADGQGYVSTDDRVWSTRPAGNLIRRRQLVKAEPSVTLDVPVSALTDDVDQLEVVVVGRCDAAATDQFVRLQLNGDGAANYWGRSIQNLDGTVAGLSRMGESFVEIGSVPAANASPSTARGTARALIHGFRSGVSTMVEGQGGNQSSTNHFRYLVGGLTRWNSQAAVTSITVRPATGNFTAGTVVKLRFA